MEIWRCVWVNTQTPSNSRSYDKIWPFTSLMTIRCSRSVDLEFFQIVDSALNRFHTKRLLLLPPRPEFAMFFSRSFIFSLIFSSPSSTLGDQSKFPCRHGVLSTREARGQRPTEEGQVTMAANIHAFALLCFVFVTGLSPVHTTPWMNDQKDNRTKTKQLFANISRHKHQLNKEIELI